MFMYNKSERSVSWLCGNTQLVRTQINDQWSEHIGDIFVCFLQDISISNYLEVAIVSGKLQDKPILPRPINLICRAFCWIIQSHDNGQLLGCSLTNHKIPLSYFYPDNPYSKIALSFSTTSLSLSYFVQYCPYIFLNGVLLKLCSHSTSNSNYVYIVYYRIHYLITYTEIIICI